MNIVTDIEISNEWNRNILLYNCLSLRFFFPPTLYSTLHFPSLHSPLLCRTLHSPLLSRTLHSPLLTSPLPSSPLSLSSPPLLLNFSPRQSNLPTNVLAPSANRKLNARAVMVSLIRLGTGRPFVSYSKSNREISDVRNDSDSKG